MFSVRPRGATEKDHEDERVANAGAQPGVFRQPGAIGVDENEAADGPAEEALEPRDPYIPEKEGEQEPQDKIDLFKGASIVEADAPQTEVLRRKHAILMDTLEEEAQRQAEERQQAQTDHEYYDHQQWTAQEAAVLMARGQAPLVFNEARGSIDWLCGTERRMRKDYRVRGRSREDDALAESKTKLVKYVDDVNLAAFHRSRTAKQMFISGLGWLEEGINLDPEKEMIYAGSEDWRRVFRDSRGREFDQSDWRYIHRRKIVDVDYACMLLPQAHNHLVSCSGRFNGLDDEEQDDIWYLGQHLTAAHSAQWSAESDGLFGGDYTVRRSGNGFDRGRRNSVELIETWYRVPEAVRVFADGPYFRKVFNPADPMHVKADKEKAFPMYSTVKWCMYVMISTKYQPCWDGRSPYRHGQFSLIPMFGYRRGSDGLMYGAMRGMRDPQDDLNKRRSKALFSLSVNQLTIKQGVVDDIEELREENSKADGILVVNGDITQSIRKEKYTGDVQANLEMAEADRVAIRNAGGVTGDNRGEDSSAVSGRAIIAKQQQGSLTTFELFDNYLLSFMLAGQRRLANIEQFCNQPWQVRIDPQGMGLPEWLHVNKFDERTGQYQNDITREQADFIVDQQDYHATLAQAAMDSMFDLLSKIATFAPNVVVNLLDLVVDSSDVPAKDVWVSRIRQMTGQTDPTKPPTPEQVAAEQDKQAKAKMMDDLNLATAQAKLKEILAKVNNTNAGAVLSNLNGLLAAVQAAAQIVTMPAIAPAADGLAQSAGFEDHTPNNAIVAAPQQTAVPPQLPVAGAPPALPAAPAAQPAQPMGGA
jgi:hypothetical protein